MSDLEAVLDEPLVGYKYAGVIRIDSDVRFRATTFRGTYPRCYDVESWATCQQGGEHRVPAKHCTCGFYAMRDGATLAQRWTTYTKEPTWATLTVELTGRTIEHEHGWRAAHQTVIAAAWDDTCRKCEVDRAGGFVYPDVSMNLIFPACKGCAGSRWVSPSDLAGRLGTDVVLTEPLTPLTARGRARRNGESTLRRRWVIGSIVPAVALTVAAVASITSNRNDRTIGLEAAAGMQSLISIDDPISSSRRLDLVKDTLGPAVVILTDGVDASGMPARLVSAVALQANDGSGCNVVLTRSTTDTTQWTHMKAPAASLEECAQAATDMVKPIPVNTKGLLNG